MSDCPRRILLAAGAAVLLGAAAIFTGLIPVAASAGHWAVTDWFLHFAMRRAVKARALGVGEPPDLADPARILQGAGHYATGCAPCHGAPGVGPSAVTRHMTPAPPLLVRRVREWEPAELFWIVRAGVKFTGMPAWPAQGREDEVWAMVAFLLRLPELTPTEYRRLAVGEAGSAAGPAAVRLRVLDEPLREAVRDCERCHGDGGAGRLPGPIPRLAGQSPAYLAASLDAFASGERHSGIMQTVAAGLDPDSRRRLAAHFAALPGSPGPGNAEVGQPAEGERIARRGVPERKVGACIHCHGPGEGPRNPAYPVLAGQYPEYLALQLRLFTEGRRGGGTRWVEIMEVSAHRLTEAQIEAVAAWYGSLGPGGR